MNIAFFDFDGTMTRRDSLFAFIAFAHSKKRLYIGLLSKWYILLGFMLGFIDNTRAKQILMSYFFADMRYDDFMKICCDFTPILETLLREKALQQLRWHKDRGDTIVLVSASFEEYLKPLCDRLGIACIATRLAVESSDDDREARLTGAFATPNCYGLQKVVRIQEMYDLRAYDEIYAYGDSTGDKEMLQLATHAFYKPF